MPSLATIKLAIYGLIGAGIISGLVAIYMHGRAVEREAALIREYERQIAQLDADNRALRNDMELTAMLARQYAEQLVNDQRAAEETVNELKGIIDDLEDRARACVDERTTQRLRDLFRSTAPARKRAAP